jgi:carbonic anhydrase
LFSAILGVAILFYSGVIRIPFAHAAGAEPAITADEAVAKLKEGNSRFVGGMRTFAHLDSQRLKEIVAGQTPFVTLLSCSDSRVAPEHLFDAGLGDLFVIRVAGNVADIDEIGTAEYGVGHLHTPLLVVLGHSSCGAVTAVCSGAKLSGSIPKLVDNIIPAVETVKKEHPDLKDKELIGEAIKMNVWQSISDLFTHSEEIRELVHEGKLKVIGALYKLEDGSVEWLGSHPQQAELLKTKTEAKE